MNKTVHYPNLFEIMNIKNDKHQRLDMFQKHVEVFHLCYVMK